MAGTVIQKKLFTADKNKIWIQNKYNKQKQFLKIPV